MPSIGKLSLLVLSCLVLQLYADSTNNNTCAPKGATLTLGDKHYTGPRTILQNVTLDLARIAWITQDRCPDGYVTIAGVNSNGSSTYKPRVEEYSQYINMTIRNIRNEGQYTRYSHIAELTDIKPGVLYLAIISSGNESTSFRFKIPDMNKKDKPLTFLHYADFDNGNVSKPTWSLMRSMLANDSNDIDFTLFNGDLAYEIVSDVGLRGDSFFEDFQSIATTRPMVFSPGNHEWFYNFSFLNYRMKMPLFNETNNHYYSWDMGLVHFISFNYDYYDNVDASSKKRMFDWIENDLKLANSRKNRTQRPWIIAYTHRPIYCSSNSNLDSVPSRCYSFYTQRMIWDELLYKYKVDLLLSGHVHNYERMGAVYKNKSMSYESSYDSEGVQIIKNPSATIHIVDGAAGNDYFMPKEAVIPNSYSIKGDLNISLSLLTVHNDSMITFKHIKSDDGSIIDQFYLKRDRSGLPARAIILIVAVIILIIVLAVVIVYYKKSKRGSNEESIPMLSKPDSEDSEEAVVYSKQTRLKSV